MMDEKLTVQGELVRLLKLPGVNEDSGSNSIASAPTADL